MDTKTSLPASPVDDCCGCGGCARAAEAQRNEDHVRAVAEAVAQGVPASVFAALDKLTPDQRAEAFGAYCKACGSLDPTCSCERDD